MKPWQTKEWKQKRAELIKDKTCVWCGSKEKLVIHHPQKKNNLTNEEYNSFEGVQILCNKCHFAFHKGMHLCPICKVKYAKNRYNECFNCQPESKFKTAVKRRHEVIEVHAPCGDLVKVTGEEYDAQGTEEYCIGCHRYAECSLGEALEQ